MVVGVTWYSAIHRLHYLAAAPTVILKTRIILESDCDSRNQNLIFVHHVFKTQGLTSPAKMSKPKLGFTVFPPNCDTQMQWKTSQCVQRQQMTQHCSFTSLTDYLPLIMGSFQTSNRKYLNTACLTGPNLLITNCKT